jgi:hypothetical protein
MRATSDALAFPAKALERLAAKVLDGDVVFFIGSGSSLDSERTSGARLLRRLLLRLLAFSDVLAEAGEGIRRSLVRTFDLEGESVVEVAFIAKNVSLLAARYFEANDWFCDAFAHFLGTIVFGQDSSKVLEDVHRREENLRGPGPGPEPAEDPVPFAPISPALLQLTRDGYGRAAGKALFLDTMGFRETRIMGGQPEADDLRTIADSYAGRLLPRYHVLARLAREGLCGTLITTNFDLLIEGAYSLAGFPVAKVTEGFPRTLISKFDVVASQTEFFTKAKAYRTAVVVKMHGCAGRYRALWKQDAAPLLAPDDPRPAEDRQDEERRKWNVRAASLREYLRAIVFTYREIQNWREDGWAADYLRTLLRTRVVVFCGYSVADPVIHDTFRTVYEEMARVRAAASGEKARLAHEAPAFFFAIRQQEFHGMAILNAASAAIGAEPDQFGTHPNYVSFHRRDRPEFPNFDEVMRWLFHLTFRKRQEECLDTDLRRISTLLLGGAKPEAELAAIRAAFRDLFRVERFVASRWRTHPGSRRSHARVCAWSDFFHTGLLREFACGDVTRQRQGAARALGLMRRFAWYYPAMQDAGWTCWGAVLEIALRCMSRRAGASLRAADCRRPTLLVQARDRRGATPYAITIQFAGFERIGLNARLLGHPSRRLIWELGASDAPWPRSEPGDVNVSSRTPRAVISAPQAAVIWRWASQTQTPEDEERLARHFGLPQIR